MRRALALLDHPRAGPTIRYGLAGATVASVYLGTPLALAGIFGLPIQLAIPVGYVLAVLLHFVLQRRFVFRHVSEFALSRRGQAARYVVIGAVQYPSTAVATAVLPGVLGTSQELTYVCTAVAISAIFFLLLRAHVFHPAEEQSAGLR